MTIDFCGYKKEQDAAEAAYEQELRTRDTMDYTKEEIAFLVARNESFVGVEINKAKLNQLVSLKKECIELSKTIPCTIKESDLENRERNQTIFVDAEAPVSLFRNIEHWKKATACADKIVAVPIDGGKAIRFSFSVLDVWKR